MSVATNDRSRPRKSETSRAGSRPRLELDAYRLFEASGPLPRGVDPERRLEEVVLTTWAALSAGHPVECPVCTGPLTAAEGCRSCGARLS